MSLRLAGRTCLIVGGTGGIGLAAARRFAAEGAKVAISGLGPGVPAETLTQVGASSQHQIDATDAEQVATHFREAIEGLDGRLDCLLHVAGISGRRLGDGPLHECGEEGWDGVMAANARSAFLTNRAATRIMLAQERDAEGLRGSIVNLGSVLAGHPAPEHFDTVAYAASKGAVRSLTLASAARYAADGIRFNLVEPGLIDTPMAARAVGDPAVADYLRSRQPIRGGPGEAEDVASALLYLCEPASRFVTGVVLRVDGGWAVSDGGPRARAGR